MQSYYQIDPASINNMSGSTSDENNSSSESLEHAMALTRYFASTFHSVMDTPFTKPQSEPPDGLITVIIIITISCICISSQMIIAYANIMKHNPRRNVSGAARDR